MKFISVSQLDIMAAILKFGLYARHTSSFER
jgi:hypothetical protein